MQKTNMIDDAINKMKLIALYDGKLNTLYTLRGKIQELITYYEYAKKDLK